MRGFNKAIIMGNLTRDPELRYTNTNRAVASFSVAVNRTWKGADGNVQEETTFLPVVAWGTTAEFAHKWLHKGSGVLVEGRISVRSYEDKNGGGKKYVTEIVADNVQFAGSSGNTSENGGYRQNPQNQPQNRNSNRYSPAELDDAGARTVLDSKVEDMDIPF